ncbi:putative M18 family aminopeptidase 2 [invertebrate metagenome]|uniref:Probable M18 family aminopeptidase 2 n=1 Tax=invertebrate metagenome TaxID=1711999 RepID=A0A2H9TAL1_9ZZZZ
MNKILDQQGFQCLNEKDNWQLEQGKKYYVIRNDASLIAFVKGDPKRGFRMVGAHTDSPCLKVKPQPETNKEGYLQLGVEVYGGALLNPWFDRDLSLAGRIQYLDNKGMIKNHLIDFRKAIAIIPSLAIHLDREANKSRSINPQTDIPPVLCQWDNDKKPDFKTFIEKQLIAEGCTECEKVMDYDLRYYDTQAPAIIGMKEEFIASARLDNLLSCFVGLQSLIHCQASSDTSLLVCNDHEEVGSQSATGAQGPFLKTVLERIAGHNKLDTLIPRSLLISTDNAHAVHPNFPDRHEGNHRPSLNKGTVIKVNANQRYATTDETSSLFQWLCRQCNTQAQYFVTRTDLACGSTIGPLTSGEIGVRTLDIGLPTFGMHSIRELAGVKDAKELSDILYYFFNTDILPL